MMDQNTQSVPPDPKPSTPNLLPPPTSPAPASEPSAYVPGAYVPQPAPRTNVWAVVSLVASVLAWCGLFGIGGIVGIIAGVIARNEISSSRGAQTGEGIALVGIILGALNVFGACCALLCLGTLPLMTLPFLAIP